MLRLLLEAGRGCGSRAVQGTRSRARLSSLQRNLGGTSGTRASRAGRVQPRAPSISPVPTQHAPWAALGVKSSVFLGGGSTPKKALGFQDKVTEGPQHSRGGDGNIMAHPVSAFQAAYISIEVLIALVSVPGNILVIWAVKMNQALRDATFCFIVSLAVADVAVGALVIPLAIIINIGPQTEFYSCLMVACPVLILTESSILALLAIAVDRYLRVKIPVRYKSMVTPRRAAVAIACCWIVSFLVGLTPMFGWNNLNKMRRTQELNATHTEFVIKCQFETVISMEYMVYFNFFVWVLPPLLLMLLIYLEVFNLIRKQLNKKVSSSSTDPQKYYGKELKIAKSLALVLFLFALSWLPLHVLNCITLFCPSCETPHILTYIAIFLTHGNSAMNPIVYAFRIKKFRTAFLQIWNQYFCCKTNKNVNSTTAEPDN